MMHITKNIIETVSISILEFRICWKTDSSFLGIGIEFNSEFNIILRVLSNKSNIEELDDMLDDIAYEIFIELGVANHRVIFKITHVGDFIELMRKDNFICIYIKQNHKHLLNNYKKKLPNQSEINWNQKEIIWNNQSISWAYFNFVVNQLLLGELEPEEYYRVNIELKNCIILLFLTANNILKFNKLERMLNFIFIKNYTGFNIKIRLNPPLPASASL